MDFPINRGNATAIALPTIIKGAKSICANRPHSPMIVQVLCEFGKIKLIRERITPGITEIINNEISENLNLYAAYTPTKTNPKARAYSIIEMLSSIGSVGKSPK